MTITDLDAYRQQITVQKAPELPEVINAQFTRQQVEWMLADLRKREKKLNQAVNDPKTKPAKRTKKSAELIILSQVINRLTTPL